MLIIGLGSGRCGTTSLRLILDLQKDSNVTHELNVEGTRRPLPWSVDYNFARRELNRIQQIKTKIKGDIGFYWLPYCEWIMQEIPDAKFICLKRGFEETVDSYMRFTEGRNHWMEHAGTEWELDDVWDIAFPKYPVRNKKVAVENYWNEYYLVSANLQETFSDNFQIFPIEKLNRLEGQKEILSFIGITEADMIFTPQIRLNVSENIN